MGLFDILLGVDKIGLLFVLVFQVVGGARGGSAARCQFPRHGSERLDFGFERNFRAEGLHTGSAAEKLGGAGVDGRRTEQPVPRALQHALQHSAFRPHHNGRLHARSRRRAENLPRRNRCHRQSEGHAHVRQHHPRHGEERRADNPRYGCAHVAQRGRQQPRASESRRRGNAALRVDSRQRHDERQTLRARQISLRQPCQARSERPAPSRRRKKLPRLHPQRRPALGSRQGRTQKAQQPTDRTLLEVQQQSSESHQLLSARCRRSRHALGPAGVDNRPGSRRGQTARSRRQVGLHPPCPEPSAGSTVRRQPRPSPPDLRSLHYAGLVGRV